MEQAPYWMWTKQKHNLSSTHHHPLQASTNIPSYNDSSWEEQAFAEDATGALGGGGCVWPPRSYSCSFCRREFRSAQALGGHMNVHRRDRARLKQSSPTDHNNNEIHHHHHQNHHLASFQYHPSHVCSLACHHHHHHHPNPNSSLPSSWPSRVSALSVQESTNNNCDDHDHDHQQIGTTLAPPSSSSPTIVQEHHKRSPISSFSPPSWANFVVGRYNNNISDLKTDHQGCRAKGDNKNCVKSTSDLSVSLNLVLHRTRSTISSSDVEEEALGSCKKRRTSSTDHASSLPFFLRPSSTNQVHRAAAEILDELSTNTTTTLEELDLELRLGDRPKVK